MPAPLPAPPPASKRGPSGQPANPAGPSGRRESAPGGLVAVIGVMPLGPLLLLGWALGAAAMGCDSCAGPKEVPFRRDAGHGATATPNEARPPQDVAALELAAGTTRVDIEGAPLSAPSGTLRAVLPIDVDGDGDRDALIVSEEEGGIAMSFARRDGAVFATPTILARDQPPSDDCVIGDGGLEMISAAYAVGRVEQRCGGGAHNALWILSVSATPRVLERITLSPPEVGAREHLDLAIRPIDHDGDGHLDVAVTVTMRASVDGQAAEGATETTLVWLNRPSGLARDRSEPEATIADLAARAEGARDADETRLRAEQALAVFDLLCEGGAAPRLWLGTGHGLPCERSVAAGKALLIGARTAARRGDVFEALRLFGRLQSATVSVARADRESTRRAIVGMARSEGVRLLTGPDVPPVAAPAAALPRIAFVDETTLMVRGDRPTFLHLPDFMTAAAPGVAPGAMPGGAAQDDRPQADRLVRDPSGRLAAVSVQRGCEGFTVRIVDASSVVGSVVAGRTLFEPLLLGLPVPNLNACPPVPPNLRDDDGGLRIVGWPPQGIVAIRGAETIVVPLTAEGAPSDAPYALSGDALPPAPLPSGTTCADGHAYVLATPFGVVLRELSPQPRAFLLRPAGMDDDGAPIEDAIISPSGTRIAFTRGNRLHVIDGYDRDTD